MAMSRLLEAPTWVKVREGAGALAADPAVLSDANYPPADAIDPGGRPQQISVYWTGTGAARVDTVDLQVLIRDGIGGRWVEGQTAHGCPPGRVMVFDVHRASMIYLRVRSVNLANAVTDLEVYAVKQ